MKRIQHDKAIKRKEQREETVAEVNQMFDDAFDIPDDIDLLMSRDTSYSLPPDKSLQQWDKYAE